MEFKIHLLKDQKKSGSPRMKSIDEVIYTPEMPQRYTNRSLPSRQIIIMISVEVAEIKKRK